MVLGNLISKIGIILKAAFLVDLFDRHEEQRGALAARLEKRQAKPAMEAA